MARRERLARPKPLTIAEIEADAVGWLESEVQTLVLLDICASSGKAPRIISLAASAVDANGQVMSTFHEYVAVKPPATTSTLLHGLSFQPDAETL